ncbi:MAG TPA: carboxylesterase family protein [Bryobacteraceae bacterium]|nr:carboxylesterase family protein [Bryobacteraceae bacterium]
MTPKNSAQPSEILPMASSRRGFLQTTTLAAAALSAGIKASAQSATSDRPEGLSGSGAGQLFFTVDTTAGKVQGIANTGIKEFKGIPYGAPTGGKNRFMPPRKAAAWPGVRDCLGYGPISPQTLADMRSDYGMMIQWDRHNVGGMGEDVLTLNVWTPGVNDGQKRAVMVSFHGGGFATGSGNGPGYDGAQLARFGDVVVVTVNHRLASFGYLNLVDAGAPAEFSSAGSAGAMDMVASLEWVRDNIANFGGDPSKVMIFGQSGGGAKTTTLLAMPSAKGLFHSAGVQSGSALRLMTREQGAKSAELLLGQLSISKSNIGDIQKISWQQILEAQTALTGKAGFSPVVMEGTALPHHPFDPAAPMESAEVPVVISTTLEDAALSLTNFNVDEAGVKAIFNKRWAGKGDEIYALYRKHNPKKTPFLLQAQAFTDSGFRGSAITQAERKAALGKAPAYMYLWSFESPGFDKKFGAVHGTDVSASFYNYRDGIGGTGSAQQLALWKKFASGWVALAKTADPNCAELPHWAPYDTAARATMVFDNDPRVENDPRSEIRKFWAEMPPAPGPRG